MYGMQWMKTEGVEKSSSAPPAFQLTRFGGFSYVLARGKPGHTSLLKKMPRGSFDPAGHARPPKWRGDNPYSWPVIISATNR